MHTKDHLISKQHAICTCLVCFLLAQVIFRSRWWFMRCYTYGSC